MQLRHSQEDTYQRLLKLSHDCGDQLASDYALIAGLRRNSAEILAIYEDIPLHLAQEIFENITDPVFKRELLKVVIQKDPILRYTFESETIEKDPGSEDSRTLLALKLQRTPQELMDLAEEVKLSLVPHDGFETTVVSIDSLSNDPTIAVRDLLCELRLLQLSNLNVGQLPQAFHIINTAQITHLDLGSIEPYYSDQTGEYGIDMFIETNYFNALHSLTHLDLSKTRLTPSGLRILTASTSLEKVQYLDLSENHLNRRSHPVQSRNLGQIISSISAQDLVYLNLSQNFLNTEVLTGMDEIPAVYGLEEIDLSHNCVNHIGISLLVAMSQLQGLTSLNLEGNSIRNIGVQLLYSADFCSRLQYLDVRNNYISYSGISGFFTYSQFPELTTLVIGNQSLYMDGKLAKIIAKNISRFPNIEEIDFSGSRIQTEARRYLTKSPAVKGLLPTL